MSRFASRSVWVTHDFEYPNELCVYGDKELAYDDMWENFITYYDWDIGLKDYIETVNNQWLSKFEERIKDVEDLKKYFYEQGILYEFGYVSEETLWERK